MAYVGCVVDGRYRLQKKLGAGSHGEVYKAVDKVSQNTVAVKIGAADRLQRLGYDFGDLNREGETLKHLMGVNGVPQYLGGGVDLNINKKYLVTNLLGDHHLWHYFEQCKERFSLKTVLDLGEKMIILLEGVHGKGYIHRDLKPDNFLFGTGDEANKLFLIDFGIAKSFRDLENGHHNPFNPKIEYWAGNPRFSSADLLDQVSPSRRDDMISVGYILIYFQKGRLPWMGLSAANWKQKLHKIIERKRSCSPEILCDGLPTVFQIYIKHCTSLTFEETPQYEYLRSHFTNLFRHIRKGRRNEFQYDWLLNSKPIEPKNSADTDSNGKSVSMDKPVEPELRAHNPAKNSEKLELGSSSNSHTNEGRPISDAKNCEEHETSKQSWECLSGLMDDTKASSSDPNNNANPEESPTSSEEKDRSGFLVRGPMELPGTSTYLFIAYVGDQPIGWFEGKKVDSNIEDEAAQSSRSSDEDIHSTDNSNSNTSSSSESESSEKSSNAETDSTTVSVFINESDDDFDISNVEDADSQLNMGFIEYDSSSGFAN